VVGLTALLADRPMPLAGYHGFVGLPKITVTDRALPIDRWQRTPQGTGTVAATITDMHPNNLTGISIDGEPNPLLVPFFADKRPGLITFHR
jgi:hypothetical protein